MKYEASEAVQEQRGRHHAQRHFAPAALPIGISHGNPQASRRLPLATGILELHPQGV